MHQPPQGETIWGTINTCMEIALNVYMIIAKDADGIEHTGIMAKKETAEKNLSSKAVKIAQEDGDWLCYDDKTKDVPIFEILQRQLATCKRAEVAIMQQMEAIQRGDKVSVSDYFGECRQPIETPQGTVTDMSPICNGIYFAQDNQQMFFAVHETIADKYMTPTAVEFGQKQGEYLFYDLSTSAIPLNELKNVFGEAKALIVSEDSLYATLNLRFRAYVSLYNQYMPEDSQIPEINAPDSLFLAVQLEAAKDEEPVKQDSAYEPDFSEETGYEIEL